MKPIRLLTGAICAIIAAVKRAMQADMTQITITKLYRIRTMKKVKIDQFLSVDDYKKEQKQEKKKHKQFRDQRKEKHNRFND